MNINKQVSNLKNQAEVVGILFLKETALAIAFAFTWCKPTLKLIRTEGMGNQRRCNCHVEP